jgi:4-diphosphocytidyl-2C-methyl-D-erythritol kinase
MQTIDTFKKIQNRKADLPILSKIIEVAQGDTGGSARCAMFLLSLWDGGLYKADLQEILYNDTALFEQMIAILCYLHDKNEQLDSFVTQPEMDSIIAAWGKQFRFETE